MKDRREFRVPRSVGLLMRERNRCLICFEEMPITWSVNGGVDSRLGCCMFRLGRMGTLVAILAAEWDAVCRC